MNRSLLIAALFLLPLWSCRSETTADGETPPPAAAPAETKPAQPAPASSFKETRLEASDGVAFDHLGFAVAAGEGVVVAGARFADAVGTDSGKVYVFSRGDEGWREAERLVPADAVEHDRFGHAVAVDGDSLAVGAHAHHDLGRRIGSVYVFRRRADSWREEARLTIPGSLRFGHAVAIGGDRLAVGAPGDLAGNVPAGAVHVFRRSGSSWTREAKLTADDAEGGDLFGAAVAISGDTIAVGASADDERGSMTGAAYVFRRDGGTWRQEAKLVPEDAAALNEVGKVVAIDGDTVVLGAEGGGEVGKFAGAAYVFRREGNGWRQEAKLLASDSQPADRFGNAVAIHGDTIAIGAHFADPAGVGSGAAYVFRRSQGGWRQAAKLMPKGAAAGDEFGRATAVHGGTVAVGALSAGPAGTSAGSVSIFE